MTVAPPSAVTLPAIVALEAVIELALPVVTVAKVAFISNKLDVMVSFFVSHDKIEKRHITEIKSLVFNFMLR